MVVTTSQNQHKSFIPQHLQSFGHKVLSVTPRTSGLSSLPVPLRFQTSCAVRLQPFYSNPRVVSRNSPVCFIFKIQSIPPWLNLLSLCKKKNTLCSTSKCLVLHTLIYLFNNNKNQWTSARPALTLVCSQSNRWRQLFSSKYISYMFYDRICTVSCGKYEGKKLWGFSLAGGWVEWSGKASDGKADAIHVSQVDCWTRSVLWTFLGRRTRMSRCLGHGGARLIQN